MLPTPLFCLVSLETKTLERFETLKFNENQYFFTIKSFLFVCLFGGGGVWPCCAACGILVPWPGIEPRAQQWKRQALTTGPPGNSQEFYKSTRRRQTVQGKRGQGLCRVGGVLTVCHHICASSPHGSCGVGFVSQAFVTSWRKSNL